MWMMSNVDAVNWLEERIAHLKEQAESLGSRISLWNEQLEHEKSRLKDLDNQRDIFEHAKELFQHEENETDDMK